jgi:retinol dehydrogenase-12
LLLDLADLSTIKAGANAFLEKETRLDVLFNNAGIMRLPKKAPNRSKQVGRILSINKDDHSMGYLHVSFI